MMTKEKTKQETGVEAISTETYNTICTKALDYMLRFNGDTKELNENYALKREHTNRVTGYTEVITRNLELCENDVQTAQIAALLHDVGRFEQFRQFQTFSDKNSVDHAELAIGLIEQNNWLDQLTEPTQNAIKKAVLFHNKKEIPKNEIEDDLLIAKIIRDADKIDILDTAVKEFSASNKNTNPFFALGLENTPNVSGSAVKQVLSGKLPDKNKLKTVNDFKIMLMAFVFDVNFRITFSIINEKQLLKKLFDTLPKTDEVFEVFRKTKIHIENQLI
jgi:HD superfamily phosphodiesterase